MSGSGPVRLHWVDYVMFVTMLLITLAIGVYHSLTGGRQRTTGEFLIGNREMKIWPVVVSLTVSYASALTLLGYPAEIYGFGGLYFWTCLGCALGGAGAAYLFLPILYPLKITSVNEYLNMRYESRLIMVIASALTILQFVFWIGLMVYTPAVAVEAVTGFPSWISIIVTCGVIIVYSSIGGFRAVIWTDVFLAFIMYAGVILVLVQSITKVGSISRVYEIANEWGRLDVIDLDPDPTKRLNTYGAIVGNGLSYLAVFGYQQIGFQRYCSMGNIKRSRRVMLWMLPGAVLLKFGALSCGITVFAYYASIGCDPKQGGAITSYNQVLTYFVANTAPIPGISGLFVSAVYAASLSSASSALNSATACLWRDILKDMLPGITEFRAATINKFLTFGFGLAGLMFAFAAHAAGGTVIQISATFSASTGGPLAALFFLGAFCPWVSWKGSSIGCLIGMVFGLWVSLGSYFSQKNWQPLPSPSSNCSLVEDLSNSTMTALASTLVGIPSAVPEVSLPVTGVTRLYSLSFVWMREAVTGVSMAASIICSGILGFRSPRTLDAALVHPMLRKWITFKPTSDVTEDKVPLDIQQSHEKVPTLDKEPDGTLNNHKPAEQPVSVTNV